MPTLRSRLPRPVMRSVFLLLGMALYGAPAMAAEAVAEAPALTVETPRNVDIRLFHAVNLKPGHQDALDPAFQAAMPLGGRGATAIALGLYAVGHLRSNAGLRQAGVLTAAALTTNALVTEGIKGVVGRRRPVEQLGDGQVRVVGERAADGRSFPSGHTSTAFAWATVLSDLYPDGSVFFYTTAAGIGIGRIRLGAHYPSDVAAGALIGFLSGQLVLHNRELILRKGHPGPGLSTAAISRRIHF